jgi:hypothetical protein
VKNATLPLALLLTACASGAGLHSAAPAPASPGSDARQTAPSPSLASIPASPPVCRHPAPASCDAQSPAYVRDVLPVLKKRCFGCHTGDGVAADELDFSQIGALRGAGTEIVDEVSTCAMPPRSRLGDEEANLLLRWVACGQRTD